MTLKKWQQEYKGALVTRGDADLFDEMLHANIPNDYDGEFTDRGRWYSEEATRQVRDRYAHNARLGTLVTPELAALLERLANDAEYISTTDEPYRYMTVSDTEAARALAACIREALEANDA